MRTDYISLIAFFYIFYNESVQSLMKAAVYPVGLYGKTALRHFVEYRYIQIGVYHQCQSAGNWCGGHYQTMGIFTFFL